jgi:hypothetical protein
MKANEFRIGNIVDYLGSPTIINSISGIEETYVSTRKSGIMPINAFKPIPLKEEWLSKFGFENHQEYFELFKRNEYFLSFNIKSNELGIYIYNTRGVRYWVNCQYVHQLQNLYFTLT